MLGRFFQCDPDIRLGGSDIYFDPQQPRPIGVISHAHADHIGSHRRFLATPATAAFLRIRVSSDARCTELAYGESHAIGGYSISFSPAGHVLGSAMVSATRSGETLLYTGDFRLRPSLTAEAAVVPHCQAVIMESTYGSPEWRFPTRETLQSDLTTLCRQIIAKGKTAVLLAYSLGKAQETLAMLRGSDLEVVVHPAIARICAVYDKLGVDLGRYSVWSAQGSMVGPRATMELRGKIVIVPPHLDRDLKRIHNRETVALTGWSLRRPLTHTDHALPLSDHADFDELLELVTLSGAEVAYVTHGSQKFARELRDRGIRAEFLRPRPQMRLF